MSVVRAGRPVVVPDNGLRVGLSVTRLYAVGHAEDLRGPHSTIVAADDADAGGSEVRAEKVVAVTIRAHPSHVGFGGIKRAHEDVLAGAGEVGMCPKLGG